MADCNQVPLPAAIAALDCIAWSWLGFHAATHYSPLPTQFDHSVKKCMKYITCDTPLGDVPLMHISVPLYVEVVTRCR
jgi:hypothetical protein